MFFGSTIRYLVSTCLNVIYVAVWLRLGREKAGSRSSPLQEATEAIPVQIESSCAVESCLSRKIMPTVSNEVAEISPGLPPGCGEEWVVVGATRVRFWRMGSGPAIVLVHGLL